MGYGTYIYVYVYIYINVCMYVCTYAQCTVLRIADNRNYVTIKIDREKWLLIL